MRRRRAATVATFSAAAIAFGIGCETSRQTSDGRPMPPTPRDAPTTPTAAPINAMAVVLGPKPGDTNGNLRPDLIQIEVYLFARPHPTPVWRDGTFEFTIFPSGQAGSPDQPNPEPLRSWTFEPDRLLALRSRTLIGESYTIGLSLLENGASDNLGVASVDLLATWRPADGGPPVFIQGVRTVSLTAPLSGAREGA